MGKENRHIPFVYPSNAWAPGYKKLLEEIEEADECPFCAFPKYHKGEVLDDIKAAYWKVGTNHPPAPGVQSHLLLVLKDHKQNMEELGEEEWRELHSLFKKLSKKYWKGGATLIFRSGHQRHTGATVGHLHAQIISSDPDNSDYPDRGILRRVG